jgi:hypothetical protein
LGLGAGRGEQGGDWVGRTLMAGPVAFVQLMQLPPR